MSGIHVAESASQNDSPKAKPSPSSSKIRTKYLYANSDDGIDENLLLLLHGLGDKHDPFFKLGRQFHLPQTAVMAIRAPDQIPFLEEDAFQWYTSFDPLGEIIAQPNPTPALELLASIMEHLVDDCSWLPDRIHLFGFSQGGSVAAEFALRWSTTHPSSPLGSIVSINGPLLSYPTPTKPCSTALIIAHKRREPNQTALRTFKKGFERVETVEFESSSGMPSSKAHWEPIMKFWSIHLTKRREEGLYEVMSGTAG